MPLPDSLHASVHHEARLLPPGELPGLLQRVAREHGAEALVVHLISFDQSTLAPLPGEGVPLRLGTPVDGTLPGRCFQTLEVQLSRDEEGAHLWLPLVDGVSRLGVVEVVLPPTADPSEEEQRDWAALVDVAAPVLLTKAHYGDAYTLARRTESLSLAAEVQWGLLPPTTFATDDVVVAAALEPAYDIAGDNFDYASNGDTLHLAVFDAMGHGLAASVLATLALAAYRHARRRALDLEETVLAVDAAVAAEGAGDRFVTAVLAQLDVPTGVVSIATCGHPAPLLVREGRLVRRDAPPPSLPLGLATGLGVRPVVVPVVREHLQPGDRLVLYTDGVVEARDRDGRELGVDRLVDLMVRESQSGRPTPEMLRRVVRSLLEHGAPLEDDASLLVLEWGGGAGRRLVPPISPRGQGPVHS